MDFESWVKKNPVITYFKITFFISWLGAFALIANKVINNIPITKFDGLLMFPVMLLGPTSPITTRHEPVWYLF